MSVSYIVPDVPSLDYCSAELATVSLEIIQTIEKLN